VATYPTSQADGVTYSCLFAEYPEIVPDLGGYYKVTVTAVVA